jgi:chemotaxis family two-component system response regulator Rcp1
MKSINRAVEILLVEDSPSDAQLMIEVFKETTLPKNLSIVKDGVEALQFLRRQGFYQSSPRPSLILLDLNLPRLNGKELLSEIKNDPNLKTIPVIVLTTSTSPSDVLKSYQQYANCYITKPIGIEDLMRVVQSIETFWLQVATLPSDVLSATELEEL